ncbi:MAG: hypothetical protein C5B49_16590 [Bdellovibrio sp.]|nr:MAG: hypothetical protein C5B49_16590 [Bdellovibrio sp.]
MGSVGYDQLIWGDEKSGPLGYGFVRPALNTSISGFVNKGAAEVVLAPLPISSIAVGKSISQRDVDVKTVDCTTANCRGLIESNYTEFNLALGAPPLYAILTERIDDLQPADKSQPFADEEAAIVGNATGDRLTKTAIILGYLINDNYSVGGMYQTQKMTNTGNQNEQPYLFVRYAKSNYAVTGAAGTFSSPTQARAPTAFVLVEWKPFPPLGFF